MSSDEHQFFHDLLNPMTVVQAKTARIKKKLESGEDLPKETLLSDLGKVIDAANRTIDLIKERRAKTEKKRRLSIYTCKHLSLLSSCQLFLEL